MLDCVVAIGFHDNDGNIVYAGTGFLYGRHVSKDPDGQDKYQVFLITNRHVLEGEKTAFLRFNPIASAPAKVFDGPLIDPAGKRLWHPHTDPIVDVAILPINVPLLNASQIQYNAFASDKHVLSHAGAAAAGLSEGDSVFVLGFPMGNVGAERNYVVVRQGCIARIRDSIAGTVKEFLVDAAVFPGNSGGPVVTRPEISSIQGTPAISSSFLIGMVSSYLPYRDVAISQQTRRPRIIFEENSGLASVVPVDRIIEVVELARAAIGAAPGVTPTAAPGQVS